MKENRKELIAKYKERKPPMGCFALVCKPTGEKFIGSSSDLTIMENSLLFRLSVGSLGQNPYLQEQYKQYGLDAFAFEILEELPYDKENPEKDYRKELKTLKELVLESLKNARELLV
ncbi:GIY-YIG nuclease family protein [uncultured Sphaerochaeta sp.]|uniref:GIY-YIG nuclease family protein n=1 Tax=uncultured Sphaerochaeta sp. TaxID=886478 RepID=UPI002A0A16C5|nr:GIY-YIG nuclease family protein [uncultured Sphaerochaeta sp.]